MEFAEFTEYLPKIVKLGLPAATAHLKMAPKGRPVTQDPEYYKLLNPRRSAVMMLIYPNNGKAHIVLIKRNTYPGIHSSQISFPGGKAEEEDKGPQQTALRETYEEVGIAPSQIKVVMSFTEIYIPPSNFLVMPFLGIAEEELEFVPNPDEVAAIIQLPLSVFLDDATVVNVPMQTSYSQNISVPAFGFGGHIVWGATAMILSELKETLKMAFK